MELGSGLGIVGLVASAAALSVRSAVQRERDDVKINGDKNMNQETKNVQFVENNDDETKKPRKSIANNYRVVLTDQNNNAILSHLKKNVDANRNRVAEASCCDSYSNSDPTFKPTIIGDLSINVAPCDWMHVSSSLQINTQTSGRPMPNQRQSNEHYPRGPFNMILGSALVYVPKHAAACADTLFYYLTFTHNNMTGLDDSPKRQAIVLQLPDRAGFTTHFLPRCRELGLTISCRELEKELVERVQLGWKRRIPSIGDYRLYFIATK